METTLPYDIDSENVLLGTVIRDIEEYDKVSKYFRKKEVFYQEKAQFLWERIVDLKRQGEFIDTASVCSSVTKKDSSRGLTKYYITGCTGNTCAKGAAEYYAIRIYEKYLLRRVIVESEAISDKAKSKEGRDMEKLQF